jgi:hypothetical protein
MIGRHFSDPLLQEDIKHYPFTVKAAAGDKPMIEVQSKGEAKTFSPEEISSMVLTKMRDIATAFVGQVGSIFFWVTRGGGLPPAGYTQHSEENPTAGGPRQSLTSAIRLTNLGSMKEVVCCRVSLGQLQHRKGHGAGDGVSLAD